MKEFNKNSLDAYVAEGKTVLVEYSAPWCVYCRRLAPAMEKIAERYAESLTVGAVNIDDEPELARRENIESCRHWYFIKMDRLWIQSWDLDLRRRLRPLYERTAEVGI